jgi:hypothetical protein
MGLSSSSAMPGENIIRMQTQSDLSKNAAMFGLSAIRGQRSGVNYQGQPWAVGGGDVVIALGPFGSVDCRSTLRKVKRLFRLY